MTYADGFNLRDKDLASFNDIADAIDGALVESQFTYFTGGPVTMSSGTQSVLSSSLNITVAAEAGHSIIIDGNVNYSVGTGGDKIGLQIVQANGTTITATHGQELWIGAGGADTTGLMGIAPISIRLTPGAGTFTYTIGWRNVTAARTIYSYQAQLRVFQVRES